MQKSLEKTPEIDLYLNSDEYIETCIELIDQAKEVIHFQTYIFEFDKVGKRIIEALKRAIDRKVKCFLLVDAFGSPDFNFELVQFIKEKGIEVKRFNEFFFKGGKHLGRRLHHKVICIDGSSCLVGGINIGEEFFSTTDRKGWFDYYLKIKGKEVQGVQDHCEHLFNDQVKLGFYKNSPPSTVFFVQDWMEGRKDISKEVLKQVKLADSEIFIVMSYFFAGPMMMNALKRAAKRGVKLKMLLPNQSDVPLMDMASKSYYITLLSWGAEIYELKDRILHAKAFLFDGKTLFLGSYNLNFIAKYADIELNVRTNDSLQIMKFQNHVKNAMKNSSQLIHIEDLVLNWSRWFRLKVRIGRVLMLMIRSFSLFLLPLGFLGKRPDL